MNRKNRMITKYSGGGALLFMGLDIGMQLVKQLSNGEKLTWEKYNGKRTLLMGLVGATGGFLYGSYIYQRLVTFEASQPFHSDQYLKSIVAGEGLSSDKERQALVKSYKKEIEEWFIKEFGAELSGKPILTGSMRHGTALSEVSDIDFILPFNYYSVSSLAEMHAYTYERIKSRFGRSGFVEKGKRSITVEFDTHLGPISVDIVPGRRSKHPDKKGDIYLYKDGSFLFGSPSSFKTNVYLQNSRSFNRPAVKEVTILLKILNNRHGLKLPGLVIQQAASEALSSSRYGTSMSITENFLRAMDYLAVKLEHVRFTDLANSNNNLNSKMPDSDRYSVADKIFSAIERVDFNKRGLRDIFE